MHFLRPPRGRSRTGRRRGLGWRVGGPSRGRVRRLPLHDRRSQGTRADLEARALRRGYVEVAAPLKGGSPASGTPAHESTDTVASFRIWRGFRSIVAEAPTGPP